MTSRILVCRPYQQQSRGSFVCNYLFDLSMELGIPITGPFLVNDSEETHIVDNTPSMEDTDRPLSPHERFEHAKQIIS